MAVNKLFVIEKVLLMENMIGREAEKKILKEALSSRSAELIAIYGRRCRKDLPHSDGL